MMSQGMKEYKISNFADLMQALKENPEWLEELRRCETVANFRSKIYNCSSA